MAALDENLDRPRIHLRLRPPRKDSDDVEDDETFQLCTTTGQIQYNAKHGMRSKITTTRFDTVFDTNTSSVEVYRAVQEDIGKSLDEGWQLILAFYGQTGSGKTHSHDGVLHPILEQIFKARPERVAVQYVQLYVDHLEDLLAEDQPTLQLKDADDALGPRDALAVTVSSAKRGLQVFRQASARRNVGENAINAYSSRSHAFLYIHVEFSDRHSCIQMVDLAGSERVGQMASSTSVDEAEVSSMMRKSFARQDKDEITAGVKSRVEGNSINKGLSQLGLCVDRCAKREHIPYRDQKLTQLFKPIWLGRGMMHLVLCIDTTDAVESQNTIDFGSRCLKLDIKPVQNQRKVTGSAEDVEARITKIVSEYKAKLSEKDDAIERLRRQIERLRSENAEYAAKLAEKTKVLACETSVAGSVPGRTAESMLQASASNEVSDDIGLDGDLHAEARCESAASAQQVAQLEHENGQLRREIEAMRQRFATLDNSSASDSQRSRPTDRKSSDVYELFERARKEQRGLWEQNERAEETVQKLLDETPGLEGELRVALENRLVMEEQVDSISRRVQDLQQRHRICIDPEEQQRLQEDIQRFQDREALARTALKQVCEQIGTAQKKYDVSDEVLSTIDFQLNNRLRIRAKLEEGDQRCKDALNELREECKGNSNKVSEIAEAYAQAIQRIEASCNTIFELRLQSEGLQLALGRLASGEHVPLLNHLGDQAAQLHAPTTDGQAQPELASDQECHPESGKPADAILQAEVNERRELLSQLKKLDGELIEALRSNEQPCSEPAPEPMSEPPALTSQVSAQVKRAVAWAPSVATGTVDASTDAVQASSSTASKPPATLGPRPFISLREREVPNGGKRRSITPPRSSNLGEDRTADHPSDSPAEGLLELRVENKRLKKREVELQCYLDCMEREVIDLQDKIEKAKQRAGIVAEKHMSEMAQMHQLLATAQREADQKETMLERSRFERKEFQRRLEKVRFEAQKEATHEAQKEAAQEQERMLGTLKEMMGKGAEMLELMDQQKQPSGKPGRRERTPPPRDRTPPPRSSMNPMMLSSSVRGALPSARTPRRSSSVGSLRKNG